MAKAATWPSPIEPSVMPATRVPISRSLRIPPSRLWRISSEGGSATVWTETAPSERASENLKRSRRREKPRVVAGQLDGLAVPSQEGHGGQVQRVQRPDWHR